MLEQMRAYGDDALPVHVEVAAGEMYALPTMHGRDVGRSRQPVNRVCDPARRPRVGMHDIDLLSHHQAPDQEDIGQASMPTPIT